MKKVVVSLMAGVFMLAFASCSSDDDKGGKSCEQLAQDYANALQAYMADSSEANETAMDNAWDALEAAGCADLEVE